MNLLQNVGEPLIVNKVASGKALEERVAYLLRVVGLRPEYMNRYPHAFSKITLFFAAGAIYTAAHKTEVSPVSYTHLDVYKRQPSTWR